MIDLDLPVLLLASGVPDLKFDFLFIIRLKCFRRIFDSDSRLGVLTKLILGESQQNLGLSDS